MLKNKTRLLYSGDKSPRNAVHSRPGLFLESRCNMVRVSAGRQTTPLSPNRHHSHYTHLAMSATTSNIHFSESTT